MNQCPITEVYSCPDVFIAPGLCNSAVAIYETENNRDTIRRIFQECENRTIQSAMIHSYFLGNQWLVDTHLKTIGLTGDLSQLPLSSFFQIEEFTCISEGHPVVVGGKFFNGDQSSHIVMEVDFDARIIALLGYKGDLEKRLQLIRF